MSVFTKSSFYYGISINENNNKISYTIGATTGEVFLTIGEYSLTDFTYEIASKITTHSGQTFTVVVDRASRILTISCGVVFSLNVVGLADSAFAIMGFTSDKTGLSSYSGDTGCGYAYYPQFLLQNFVTFDDYVEPIDALVSKSASGKTSIVSFGSQKFMECNITFATDRVQASGAPIENNPSGVSDLRSFMNYLITKGDVEFMQDRTSPNTYKKCVLESTPLSKDGAAFKLNELYGRGAIGYFETGILKFRERT